MCNSLIFNFKENAVANFCFNFRGEKVSKNSFCNFSHKKREVC